MMFSDDRKYTLSGWFQVHERKLYNRPYKLQIFLILYEFFSEIENDSKKIKKFDIYRKKLYLCATKSLWIFFLKEDC